MKKILSIFMLIGVSVLILGNSQVNNRQDCAFTPVEMPSNLKNGHSFPTDSTVIQSWIDKSYALNGLETNPDMISHAWGLWQALTERTKQSCDGRQLLRYETWYTPQDVMRAMAEETSLPTTLGDIGDYQSRPKFDAFGTGHSANLNSEAGDIVGRVKYSPSAAQYAFKHRLFDTPLMQKKAIPGGIATINMPNSSVLLKPIYRVLSNRLKIYPDGMYRFHVWSGKVDGGKDDADFEKYIYVCTQPNDSRIDNQQVFGIADFIHHRMSQAEATAYNETKSKEGAEYAGNVAQAGDVVILLGMHVSTRETTRWTWQSFYWSPNPDNPVFPSSAIMAAGRSKVKDLSSPANHYAVSLGYNLLSPAGPNNLDYSVGIRTDNRGSVYALNPYIEGTFGPDVFANQEQIFTQHGLGSLFKPRNIAGLTSSCMGCHSQAYFTTDTGEAAGTFIADQYVPRNAPWFIGKVQTDFAWSLSGAFEQPFTDFKE